MGSEMAAPRQQVSTLVPALAKEDFCDTARCIKVSVLSAVALLHLPVAVQPLLM